MSIEIDEIKKVKLGEGDILLVHVNHPALKLSQRDGITKHFEGIFPNNKILILEQGFSLGVLTKKELHELPDAMDGT
mgnify:CR=1 FL=1